MARKSSKTPPQPVKPILSRPWQYKQAVVGQSFTKAVKKFWNIIVMFKTVQSKYDAITSGTQCLQGLALWFRLAIKKSVCQTVVLLHKMIRLIRLNNMKQFTWGSAEIKDWALGFTFPVSLSCTGQAVPRNSSRCQIIVGIRRDTAFLDLFELANNIEMAFQ